MKIAIVCNSLLLQNSLKIFLKEYLSTYKHCDLVVSDHELDTKKPVVIVNSSEKADVKIPFSKSSLLLKLQEIYGKIENKSVDIRSLYDKEDKFTKLEKKINRLTDEFKKNIIEAVREYYE